MNSEDTRLSRLQTYSKANIILRNEFKPVFAGYTLRQRILFLIY
jgi:hypothetical protein